MELNEEDIKELEKLYLIALRDEKEVFLFKGREMFTEYVKYLLEYTKG